MAAHSLDVKVVNTLLGLLLLSSALSVGSSAQTDTFDQSSPTVTTVMSGLANPRGLAFDRDGALYVAEAGRGGAGPCIATGAQIFCYGPSGGVSRLYEGVQQRIVSGLPSLAMAPSGARAVGAHDIAMLGVGSARVTIGLENDPATRNLYPEFAGFGRLVHVTPGGQWAFVSDISAYEAQYNPDGRLNADGTPHHDSNPFGLLALPGKHLVTDAGANALLSVNAVGQVSLIATFHSRGTTPPRQSCAPSDPPGLDPITDAVPTSVVAGPDGAYYVSELTGVPFVDGTANIHRVVPNDVPQLFLIGDNPCVDGFNACITGFKMILDMDFDSDGNLYVLQHATGAIRQTGPGVLIRVTPDKTQPDVCAQYQMGVRTTVLSGLTGPTSVVVGPDGALYVTNRGNSGLNGEVFRVVQ